jgi:hypothetical protein
VRVAKNVDKRRPRRSFPSDPNTPVVKVAKMLAQVATDVFVVPGGGTVVGWFLDEILPDPGRASQAKSLST